MTLKPFGLRRGRTGLQRDGDVLCAGVLEVSAWARPCEP
ncbi:hypothetical protein SAMCCGM7_Ch2243 [Sinorhizobium americanum CCGM7]|nr:hypothetical protein SAMCCGM7_Ch2243 [Sinorhizobium americanum CCGM7]